MILGFVCCSNPSGSTNNNTLDYCDICDGVQDESHEHDYCLECDGVQGQDHEHQVVTPEPTEPTYDEYFHITTIGGENSPYKVAYPDDSEYISSITNYSAVENLNDYQSNYKKYIESLTFSDEFKSKYVTSIGYKTFDNYNDSANSITNVNKGFDYLIENINNVCAPIFEEITKNIKISDNALLDQMHFMSYYNILTNEAYKLGRSDYFNSSTSSEQGKEYYDSVKAYVIDGWNFAHSEEGYNVEAPITDLASDIENGCPQIIAEMDKMIVAAANKMGVTANDLRNAISLSLTMDSLKAVDEYTSATTGHTAGDICPANTMLDVIESVDASLISKATKKLYQSIFKRDLGREMC